MPNPMESLAEAVRQRNAILFVGAGVSMSVGLPSWDRLTRHMEEELRIPVESTGKPRYSYQTLAEYYRLKQGSLGPLRSWMDRNWSVSRERVKRSVLHRLIVELDFPIIYTTNYDRNLEVAFEIHGREFVKVANARDVSRIRPDATQIVKYHGDFDEDASLVLTETDYFNRLSFDSPLDMKFRADALGRTILFIGYSISDMNIRLLLHRLWQTWRDSGYEQDRPPSFVFMPRRNPVEEAVLARWGISALSEEGNNPQEALGNFLKRLAAIATQKE
ncbi:SIR2 family protein [Chelativorans sp. Marseille-P2723]|uniref:SIR2 family NAD-dependent protein deacylase n=1 Tax=Chelativorans sp. Marseille-P2723 TaxID=2709133 RepID=UPI001570CF67|nr:SIR2 family protein [Chelativorans sp. Marseille-P2723]